MTAVLGSPPTPSVPATRLSRSVAGHGRPRRQRWVLLLFVAPAVVLVAAVIYYSVGYTFWLSLTDSDGIDPGEFVGADNFVRAVGDPTTWAALGHSAAFLLVIPTQMLLGLVIAALLHSSVRLKGLYKVVVFIPTITATAVMAPVFRQELAANGSVNGVLEAVGLGSLTQAWLGDPAWALPTLMVINVWQWTGLSFILYYAGLTQIEASTVEAARLDGASNLRVLTSIVVPMMRGTHVTLLILGVMGVLKTFDLVFLVTGGGPAKATEFLSTYIYETTITRFDAGYGAALSVLLLALSLTFTVWQMRRYRKAGGAGV